MGKAAQPAPDIAALPGDALLTRRQLSQIAGFSLQTLKQWPAQGRGPRVVTVKGRPHCRVADIREWMGAADRWAPQRRGRPLGPAAARPCRARLPLTSLAPEPWQNPYSSTRLMGLP